MDTLPCLFPILLNSFKHRFFWLRKPIESIGIALQDAFKIFVVEKILAISQAQINLSEVFEVDGSRLAERGTPHLGKGVDNGFEFSEVDFALGADVHEFEGLDEAFFFVSVHHDVDVIQILVEFDVTILLCVHHGEHAISHK